MSEHVRHPVEEVSASSSPRGVLWFAAIAVLLIVASVVTYFYHETRLDAEQRQAAMAVTGGDPDRAMALLTNYGCAGCHVIPGVPTASGLVGPDLKDVARRIYVGGVITNTPDHLVQFIVDPQSVDEKSAMPKTGITPDQARDVAAYLYAIRP